METHVFTKHTRYIPSEYADMKPFEVRETKDGKIICRPDNCNHPRILPHLDCKAIHPSNPECGCCYCVFNKFFNQANNTINNEEEQSEE